MTGPLKELPFTPLVGLLLEPLLGLEASRECRFTSTRSRNREKGKACNREVDLHRLEQVVGQYIHERQQHHANADRNQDPARKLVAKADKS